MEFVINHDRTSVLIIDEKVAEKPFLELNFMFHIKITQFVSDRV